MSKQTVTDLKKDIRNLREYLIKNNISFKKENATLVGRKVELIEKVNYLMQRKQITNTKTKTSPPKTSTPSTKTSTPSTKIMQFIPTAPEFPQANAQIPAKKSGVMRVMTYNVQEWLNEKFDQKWKAGFDAKYREHRQFKQFNSGPEIRKVIKEMNPDVVGIQETSDSPYAKQQHKALEKEFHIGLCKADSGWEEDDKYTLHNGLLINKSSVSGAPEFAGKLLGNTERPRCLQVSFAEINGIPMVLATAHLDYEFRDQLINIKNAIKYLKSLKTSNIILMGDFNTFAPNWGLPSPKKSDRKTYDYIIKQGYTDTVKNWFKTIPSTPPSRPDFAGRIDFIFTAPGFPHNKIPILGAYVHYNYHSDHFPVIVDFGVGQQGGKKKKRKYPFNP